jgi:colanic acid biosynthesis glycosyl transferase WcaI
MGFTEKDVIILYSGNMGAKQGLEIAIDAAASLVHLPFIHFVICGDGIGKSTLKRQAQGLSNVSFKPLQTLDRLNDLLNLADIHILPQRIDAADLVFPSKLTNMLASARPVVATVNPGTEIWGILENRGLCVQPGNAKAFASAIKKLALNPALRKSLGSAARNYAETHLGKESVLKNFELQLFKSLLN